MSPRNDLVLTLVLIGFKKGDPVSFHLPCFQIERVHLIPNIVLPFYNVKMLIK